MPTPIPDGVTKLATELGGADDVEGLLRALALLPDEVREGLLDRAIEWSCNPSEAPLVSIEVLTPIVGHLLRRVAEFETGLHGEVVAESLPELQQDNVGVSAQAASQHKGWTRRQRARAKARQVLVSRDALLEKK